MVSLSSPDTREIFGQELAGLPVHGAKRLHGNGLEDVLVFQCAVFCDLAGGGQLGNSTGGCRLQVGVGQWADDRHIPAKGFAFMPWDQRQAIGALAI